MSAEFLTNTPEIEAILCAAIHFDDGKGYKQSPKNITTGFVVCGFRHGNCSNVAALIPKIDLRGTQGFLTNLGRFVDRKEGWTIAEKAGQVEASRMPGVLLSEDLY